MNIGDLFFALRGNDARLQVDVKKAAGTAGDTFSKGFSVRLGDVFKGGAVLGAGATLAAGAFGALKAAVGGIGDVLTDATQAAIAEEASISKLGTSLRANIPEWNGNTDAIERVLKARMALAFSDDEQRQSLALLVAATHDETKALDIQRTAMDLARLKGISLQAASEALVKVEAGQFRILKSLGIQLPKNATATEALAAVQAVATGQAEAYADTAGGKQLRAQVAIGEAMEKFGQTVLPVVAEGLNAVTFALDRTMVPLENLEQAARKGSQGAAAHFRGLQDIADELGISIERAWELSNEAGTLAVDVIRRNMMNASDAIDRAERDINVAAGGTGDALDGVGDKAGDMGDDVEDGAETAAESIEDMRDRIVGAAKDVVSEAYGILDDRAELSATNAEIAAQRRILASETASSAEKRDARDTLRDLGEDQASLVLSLAEAGSAGSKAVSDALVDMRERLTTAVGQERKAIEATIKALELLETQGGKTFLDLGHGVVLDPNTGGKRLTGRARGGPTQRGVPYLVGEKRPEVFVPSERGYVLPSMESPAFQSAARQSAASWTGGGTQTIEVPVYLDGQVITRVVARNLADELNH